MVMELELRSSTADNEKFLMIFRKANTDYILYYL